MSCGDAVERGVATCVCKGQTVFEGAVIGQVFTGDVQMQCPHAQHHHAACVKRERASAETGRPLSTALVAIAIWQATYPTPAVEAVCSSSLSHAAMLLVAGAITRYLKPRLFRWITRLAKREGQGLG